MSSTPNPPMNDWETSPQKESTVQTSHAKLHLLVSGPPRQKNEPIVIIIPGLSSAIATWRAVINLLAPKARVLQYDRAGLGKSSRSTAPRTATNMASELAELLEKTEIAPPYLVVTQSYGGIIAREFVAQVTPSAIAGLVLVDANQEDSHARMGTPDDGDSNPILGGIKYRDAIGYSWQGRLTAEEAEIMDADEKQEEKENEERKANPSKGETEAGEGAESEWTYSLESCRVLGEKKQLSTAALDPRPVTVIKGATERDFRRIVAYAEEHQVGTPKDREDFEKFAQRLEAVHEDLIKEQLQLSSCHRYVVPDDAGHNVHYWDPAIVAREILFVLDYLKSGTDERSRFTSA